MVKVCPQLKPLDSHSRFIRNSILEIAQLRCLSFTLTIVAALQNPVRAPVECSAEHLQNFNKVNLTGFNWNVESSQQRIVKELNWGVNIKRSNSFGTLGSVPYECNVKFR